MTLLMALGAALAQAPLPDEPYPYEPTPYPAQPAPYPVQPAPYPVQPAPYPVQPAPYPVQPAPYPVQPTPYPVQPTPYPVQPAPYPVQPAPYPVGSDLVFVAPLQARDPAFQAEAQRLTALLEADIAARHAVRTIRDVPPWPDYNAWIYMMSCPPGQYSGCALVCGDRVAARWTVGGTVGPGLAGGAAVDLVFIENAASREVLAYGIALDGTNDLALTQGAHTILGKITSGAFDAIDLRAVDTSPAERAKLDAVQRQLLADSVAELERQQGQVVRETTEGPAQQRLTREQVAAMNQRDDVKPWERVHMKEAEYLRYRNSGKDLDTWRRLRRGRLGQVIGRVALGAGSGPFGQAFDGRYALNDQLQVAHLEQYQYITRAPHAHADFELGFGVLPFLDITGHLALRSSRFGYLINQEKMGDVVFVDPRKSRSASSWQAGVRGAFVPFPAWTARPALHGGLAYWQGETWQSYVGGVQALQPMQKLTMLVLQAGPGVELTAGPTVNLFVRGFLDIPVGGNLRESYKDGGPGLRERADPEVFPLAATGFTIQAGLTGRLTLIRGTSKRTGSSIRFEEEEP